MRGEPLVNTTDPDILEAIEGLEAVADAWVVEKAEDMVASGQAYWIKDPYVDQTFGLVDTMRPGYAYLIVYMQDPTNPDFEMGSEMHR